MHGYLARVSPATLSATFALTLLAWAFLVLGTIAFLNSAAPNTLRWEEAMIVFVFTSIGGAIPALPGGLGTYEAAAVLALQRFGLDFNESLALALGLRLCNIALTVPWALLVATRSGTGLRATFRRLVEEWRRSSGAD